MTPSIDVGNFARSDTTSVHLGLPSSTGALATIAGVPITNLYGLRRWRAQLADAFNSEAHIVCGPDSHSFGQLANGNNSSLNTDRAADNQLGYVGNLRARFATQYGATGEGFCFPSNVADSRITEAGSPIAFLAPGQSPSVSLINRRLTSNAQTLTFTVPTGVTRVVVGQGNFAGNVSSTWSLNAVGQGSISTLTNTGTPQYTTLTVVAGQAVVITGPSSGNDVFLSFTFRTAQTSGVVVHNVGVGGQTAWRLLGGSYSGADATNDGTNFYTTAQQIANLQASYKHTGAARGLFILYTGTNEQGLQQTAGLGGQTNPQQMQRAVQTIVNQVAADGWCTLLVGPPPSGSELLTGLPAIPLTGYTSLLQTIATQTDHCAYVNLVDLWGSDKLATSNAGLRDPTSSHPTRAGYGDIARMLFKVLDSVVPIGN